MTCDLPGAPVLARHTGLRLEACRVRGPAVALGSGRHKTRRIRTLRGMGGVLLTRRAASDWQERRMDAGLIRLIVLGAVFAVVFGVQIWALCVVAAQADDAMGER